MVEFKVVVSDPKEGKSYQVHVEGHYANSLISDEIGEKVDGVFVNLPGYTLQIMGGSDIDGFPMKKNVPGPGRQQIVGKGGVGFKETEKSVRKKKTVRGNTISADINQINMKVVEHGPKKIEDLLKEDQGDN